MDKEGDQPYEYTAYNLDVIISVGYRVKSKRGTKFRQWANKILKEYLLKGYVVDTRIKSLEHQVSEQGMQIKDLQNKVDFFVRSSLPPVDVVYLFGASLKDAGKKLFAYIKMQETSATDLLNNIK